jgi:hypothetical protein
LGAEGKREKRETRGWEELGQGAAHAGEGRKGGPRGRERRGEWAGRVEDLGCLLLFLLLFFSFPHSNYSNNSI